MIPNMTELTGVRKSILESLMPAIKRWWEGEPIPYIWGGASLETGVDCSGFVILILQKAALLPVPFDDTAHGLFNRFPRTTAPETGDLVFFGTAKKVTHVGMYFHDGLMIESGGGDSSCTTKEIAYAKKAWVRVSSVSRRRDLRGYGKIK